MNKNNSLSSIFNELSKLDEDSFPPVEEWNPPLCENVHMRIDRSGKWYFMNSPIGRERMVRLFSRVLRLDGEEYFLVTPIEKIKVEVEDRPFVITDFDIQNIANEQVVQFKTNTDEIFDLNLQHPLRVVIDKKSLEPSPYVRVRSNLEGLISRNVYYKLIDHCEEVEGEFGIYSSNIFYKLN